MRTKLKKGSLGNLKYLFQSGIKNKKAEIIFGANIMDQVSWEVNFSKKDHLDFILNNLKMWTLKNSVAVTYIYENDKKERIEKRFMYPCGTKWT